MRLQGKIKKLHNKQNFNGRWNIKETNEKKKNPKKATADKSDKRTRRNK